MSIKLTSVLMVANTIVVFLFMTLLDIGITNGLDSNVGLKLNVGDCVMVELFPKLTTTSPIYL